MVRRRRAHTSVVATDDSVVVGSKSGEVRMLDATTGLERWRADHAGEVGRFTMNEEDLFVGIGENVACLRRTSGALKWAQPTGQLVTGRPAADARHVYAGGVDSFVYALRAHDGHVRWRFKTHGPVEANLVLASGVVYAGSHDHKVYALDTAEGERIWALDVGAPVVALTLVGNLLIASTPAALVAVDARTGVASWTKNRRTCGGRRRASGGAGRTGTDLKLTAAIWRRPSAVAPV